MIIRYYPEFWEYIDDDVREKIRAFVEHLPAKYIDDIDDFLDFVPLKEAAKRRAKKATFKELRDTSFYILHEVVADRMIQLFLASTSFDQANQRSVLITNHISDYTKEQIEVIIRGAGENLQIRGCFELSSVVNLIKKSKTIGRAKFDQLLEESGLDKFKSQSDEETV